MLASARRAQLGGDDAEERIGGSGYHVPISVRDLPDPGQPTVRVLRLLRTSSGGIVMAVVVLMSCDIDARVC